MQQHPSEVKPRYTPYGEDKVLNHHRNWGNRLYMVNADAIELDGNGEPLCIIDYKFSREMDLQFPATGIDLDTFSLRALARIADALNIPFFVVGYDNGLLSFAVIPRNQKAKELFPEEKMVDEEGFVRLLYKLRNLDIPEDIIEQTRSRYMEAMCQSM